MEFISNTSYNSRKITKFTIFGERCSGTNYLEYLIKENFGLQVTWEYGWKHFFGHKDLESYNTENCLFLAIFRNPYDWVNSFYKARYHVPKGEDNSILEFISREWKSVNNSGKEIMEDRNIEHPNDPYANICEMRTTKLRYLLNTLPTEVDNYFHINYEKLRDYPGLVLDKIAYRFNLNFINSTRVIPDFDVRIYNHQSRIVLYKKHYQTLDFAVNKFIKRYLCEQLENHIGYTL